MKQVQGLFRVVRRHQLVFNRGYGSDITVTIVSLFIGLIIEIMRLILEFLKCENLGTRIFKYSHTPSETREFRYDWATCRPKTLMNLFLMRNAKDTFVPKSRAVDADSRYDAHERMRCPKLCAMDMLTDCM